MCQASMPNAKMDRHTSTCTGVKTESSPPNKGWAGFMKTTASAQGKGKVADLPPSKTLAR